MSEEKIILYGPDNRPLSKAKDLNLDPGFFLRRSINGSTVSEDVKNAPYASQPFVYACANAIQSNIARLPRVLSNRKNPEQETTQHSFLDFLQKPNELMAGDQLWEATLLYLLLPTTTTPGGQCFWVACNADGSNYDFTSQKLPYYLFPFTDRFFKPIIDSTTYCGLIGWEFSPPGTSGKIQYKLNEVVRFVLTNPYNLLQGLSPLAAAKYSLSQDSKSTELNSAYFENGASLGGVLQTDQKLTDETARQMAVSWRENHGGSNNAGKTAVLHTGLKYEQIDSTHVDMEYIQQKKLLREDIMAVFGVPKAEVALYEDVNFATAQSADKSFWEKKLIPFDEKILKVINGTWLKFLFGGSYSLKSDFSRIECLRAGLLDQANIMKVFVSMAIPVVEAARLAHVPINVALYPWLKKAFVPGTLVLASAIGDAPLSSSAGKIPPDSNPDSDPNNTTDGNGNENVSETDPTKSKRKKIGAEVVLLNRLRKEMSANLASMEKFLEEVIDPIEEKYVKSLSKFFILQRNKVLDAVDAWVSSQTKKAALDVPKNFWSAIEDEENEQVAKITAQYYDAVIAAQTDKMKEELGGELVNFEIDNKKVQAFKAARLKDLASLNTTTFNAAGKKITDVLASLPPDTSVKEAAQAIKKVINNVYSIRKNQATVIARTELAIVSSSTRNEIMKEEGVEYQEWLSIIDDKTRDGAHGGADHVSMNGEVVKIGEAFSNGLMFPSDPSGPAEEVICCRCANLPNFEKQ